MKALLFSCVLLLAGAVQPVHAAQVPAGALSLYGQSTNSAPIANGFETSAEKSPVTACVLSLVIPGLGQHYNGQHAKGFIQEFLFVGGFATMIVALAGGLNEDWTWEDWSEPVAVVGLSVSGASYLWSVIDAPISASRINARIH